MPKVASVNYVTKKIYLHSDTMDAELDTLDVYREVRALRRTTEAHRKFDPMIEAGGNLTKIDGVSYTAAYARLLNGCRIVPCGDADHDIKLIRDTFTDDGYSGRDCFDRSGLSNHVDIDVDFPEIEIRTVSTGSGLSTDEHDRLFAIPSAGSMADAVLSELIADHKAAGGSLAAAINEIRQRHAGAKLIADRDANTIKVYDENGIDLLFTLTKTTVGNVDTYARS